jgi:hypothetical protein
LAFFIPTDGDERIECINPTQLKPADMDKIMNTIEELKENFQVNVGEGE